MASADWLEIRVPTTSFSDLISLLGWLTGLKHLLNIHWLIRKQIMFSTDEQPGEEAECEV